MPVLNPCGCLFAGSDREVLHTECSYHEAEAKARDEWKATAMNMNEEKTALLLRLDNADRGWAAASQSVLKLEARLGRLHELRDWLLSWTDNMDELGEIIALARELRKP